MPILHAGETFYTIEEFCAFANCLPHQFNRKFAHIKPRDSYWEVTLNGQRYLSETTLNDYFRLKARRKEPDFDSFELSKLFDNHKGCLDLRGINLRIMHSSYESLYNINLSFGKIIFSNLSGIVFKKIDFTKVDFTGSTFSNCTFINCLFEEASFRHCKIYDTTFTKCSFYKTDFTRSYFKDITFNQVDWFKPQFQYSQTEVCPLLILKYSLEH